jgi:hypothetical protein
MMPQFSTSRREFVRGDHMKTRSILLTLATVLLTAMVCFAAPDVNMGTWKLNEAKSKINPATGKNATVVYAMVGDSVKVTVDGLDANGKPAHSEWTGKFDGKDYPVTGDPDNDMRSYKRITSHILALTDKKEGKVTLTGRVVVSADGKSRVTTLHGTDAKGNKISSMQVYDKQ